MRITKRLVAIAGLCVGAVLLGMAVHAVAQTSTGTVLGTVTDQSGATIAGAQVVLKSTTTGAERATQTQPTGHYEFPFVPPDTYQVSVKQAGFRPVTVQNVVVRVNETIAEDVQLQVGAVSQEVTVTAQVAKVDSTTATLGAVTGYSEITTLPILGRSFIALATLSAGTVSNYPGKWSGCCAFARSDVAVSISGSQDFLTTNLIDGVPTKSQEYGDIGYQLPLEMIQEFSIQRGFYSAKYTGPGVVNVVSRSGKNQIHGSAWETIRNDKLDSRSFFDKGIPKLRQNHFGGSFGGPIKKDKLFYFGNVQFVRDIVGYTVRGSVPTAQEKQGDLSDIPNISIHLLDGTPIANAKITTIDPFAQKYMALGTRLIPEPNLPGPLGTINISHPSNKTQNDNFIDVRVDYNRSEKDSLFARVGYGQSNIIQQSLTAYTNSVPFYSRNVVIGYTHVFTPALFNEFHAGLDRVNFRPNQPYGPGIPGENFNQELGLVGANQYPSCNGPTSVNITGASSFGYFLCDITLSNDYTYSDSLAWIHGRHSFQFGTDLTRYQVTNPIFNAEPGAFYYTGQYSGNAWADFLLGYVQNATALVKVATPYRRAWGWGLYAEDTYQVRKHLTVDVGLRWELPTPALDKYDNLAVFTPLAPGWAPNTPYCFQWAKATSNTTLSGQPICAPKYGRALVKTNYKDISPRVGLAWMPFGKEKWAVRASFGLFYVPLLFNEESFNSLGFPVVTPYQDSGTSSVPTTTAGQFAIGQSLARLGGYLLGEDPERTDPYSQQWTLSIQRQLPGSAVLSVAYLGNHANHLFVRTQYNVAHLGTTPLAERLPFPALGAILYDKSIATSNYNALQVDLEKRYSHNTTFRLAYTYSNAMDDAQSQSNSEMLPWDIQLGWQRTNFNLKHNFVFSHTYLLPFGRGHRWLNSLPGPVNKLISGWQSVGILSAHTGFPMSVGAPGFSNTNTEFFGGAQPVRTCSGRLAHPTIQKWFDYSCFYAAPPNTWGNAGRAYLDQPGYFNWDLSATKDTKLTERLTLQFRAEFFNAFNKANFNGPNATVTVGPNGSTSSPFSPNPPLVGVITGAGKGREIQGVVRFFW